MNHTRNGGFTNAESAFAFINNQVKTYRQTQKYRYERIWSRAKRSMALCMVTALVTLTNWTNLTTQAYEDEPGQWPERNLYQQPAFDSAIRLDTESFTLLAIEELTPTIKPGKSVAQAQLEAARARQLARPSGFVASSKVATVSTDEAHQLAQAAARQAGIPDQWKLLAAIWQKETGKKVYSCVVSKADGRTVGPMQFMPGTFNTYKDDGDGDGLADICNAKDALVAAANLLKANGLTDGKVDQAVHRYNHSMVYVRSVKQIADSID